jgi:hypothetical protein
MDPLRMTLVLDDLLLLPGGGLGILACLWAPLCVGTAPLCTVKEGDGSWYLAPGRSQSLSILAAFCQGAHSPTRMGHCRLEREDSWYRLYKNRFCPPQVSLFSFCPSLKVHTVLTKRLVLSSIPSSDIRVPAA